MPNPLPQCCPTHLTEAEDILKQHKKFMIFSPRARGPDPIRKKFPDRYDSMTLIKQKPSLFTHIV